MTTQLPNETKMQIQDTLTAVGYAEGMIRLADQFRREGNHAAANGALMMAWDIRENTKDAMATLTNLAPEHAELLGQAERQRLWTELNASYENLNRLGFEHYSTEDQWDECNEQETDWYKSCFEVGLAAQLANAITTRAESLPQSEENSEMVADAVGECYWVAQESMEHARKIEPPADCPFPQTRQQSMERALDDCAKLSQLDKHFQEKLEAAQDEADNSLGLCHLCGNAVRAEDVGNHIRSCVTTAVQSKFANRDWHPNRVGDCTVLVGVRGGDPRLWLSLAVRPTANLRQLDQFLRDVWLECCGHMSHFEIGGARYSARIPGHSDIDPIDFGVANTDEGHMMYTVDQTIREGELFRHEYDHDDPTYLYLECLAILPAPYHVLPELIDPPDPAEGHTDDFISILARNLPPGHCFICGSAARWSYYENPYIRTQQEQSGSSGFPPFFCDDCAPRNATLTQLRNSPRVGAHCYDNVHNQPEPPSQSLRI